ncbi:MAG TPA: tetraacyldisaccharide 4'-kinase [Acidobacteriaceae bacterium]
MSRALLPLVPLYAAAVGAKDLAYARRWAKPQWLRGPVISVGNVSVGGSGKTPLTIRLAELLREREIAVDVLSRGYGRDGRRVEGVDAGGSAEEFGDEPLLIARSAGVPVYVGASRYAAGVLAESESPVTRVHLLDDGFQHRRLARDVDIVVLHRSDFGERLLPAGRLREPLPSLSRAQILVLREEDRDLEPELRRRGLCQPVWFVERRLEVPTVRRVVAFCAIARPEEFFAALRQHGVEVAAQRSWRDHHRFRTAEIDELMAMQRERAAEGFLTTEKDLVRLSTEQREKLARVAPVLAARLLVRVGGEAAAVAQLLAMLPGFPGLATGTAAASR